MANKGTHGYPENENKSYDDYKSNMANIDDEVDRILAEQRKAKQQIDFFSEHPIDNTNDEFSFDSSSLSSNSPKRSTYTENTENYNENSDYEDDIDDNYDYDYVNEDVKVKNPNKNYKQYSYEKSSKPSKKSPKKNNNKKQKNNKNKIDKKTNKKSKGKNKNSEKKKHTGLKIFITLIIIIGALCGGVYLYFGGVPTREDIENLLPISDSVEPTSSTSIHETLVVVTVTGDSVSYNGEFLINLDELENRLAKEESLTLSLINNDAVASTYNDVANILNKYGGNFELMDENNTNPSINTVENTTTETTDTETTTESVAESTTEATSEPTSLAE